MTSLTDLELTRFFFALVLLLLFAHTFRFILNWFKLPRVIGEIFGGLLLGPTVLGYLFPEAYKWIFAAFDSEGKLLSLLSWLGLVLLMFISGFEIQRSFDQTDRKIILALILGSTIPPFIAGWIAPLLYDFSPYLGIKQNQLALQLVIAIATAITSIPVISRIFLDLKVMNTRFAKIVLTIATIHDVLLWVILAIATGLVNAETSSASEIASTVFLTLLFFVITLFLMPRVVGYVSTLRWNLVMRSSSAGYILFICFLFAAFASFLNVNIVFGALLAGIVVGILPQEKLERARSNVKQTSLGWFIPLYFALVGLKLNLIQDFDLKFFLLFLVFTTIIQMVGTLITARILGQDWLSSFNLGTAMSTRGGPGIVLATVAYDLGIINEVFFVAMVLTAIVTSLLAGTWFRFVLRQGWHLMKEQDEEVKFV